jgi:hypothetical protein
LRKKTVRWTVFADVGNERSEAREHGSARQNPYPAAKKESTQQGAFFFCLI